jgi:dienelactone hydrolase
LKKRGEDTDQTKSTSDITTVDATIPVEDGGQLTAILYTPAGPGPFPAVVYFHGVDGCSQIGMTPAHELSRKGRTPW